MAEEHPAGSLDDLDDLLDSVLDDFQKVETGNHASTSSGKATAASRKLGGLMSNQGATLGQGLGLGLPELKKKGLSPNGGVPKGLGPTTKLLPLSKPKLKASSSPTLGATLEKLRAETRQTVESIDSSRDVEEPAGNELVDNLVRQFEDLGGSQDMQSIMDTMMHQLLSKEVLHEPMKEIGEKYPEWLATNESALSKQDFERYSRQYEHIKQLCAIYETTPDDFQQIVDLMHQMQECGQPPSDIIRELAPGLELGEDGLPVLPDAAGGAPGGLGNCNMM